MLLGGLQKLTLIDYPGKIAATVFTVGCNFDCPFCHNPELVDPQKIKKQPRIAEKYFFEFLDDRRGMLEGVCITGGEPTLQPDLPDFISQIKNLGFLVKLDTNGTNPTMLEKLLAANLVDFVAMDIKAPLEKYKKVAGKNVSLENIQRSVELTRRAPDYEFRTTVLPALHSRKDILSIEDVYLFHNEDSKYGFHLWIFPRYQWMEQFGRKIESVRPIINYAKENMANEESFRQVKENVAKMRDYMKSFK
ncbi:MAG: pyruvate formate lyase activating enzyme [Parcubacteria group bacterium LiPW_39]|nr:MAG: pyruvate formate lyase activating enzyme [Parcubacteria group bacterium LiPW_39]